MSNNSIKGVSTNFKALQARSNALGLGLNYSDEMLRAAKILRGIRISGGVVGGAALIYDGVNTFGANPSMTQGEFLTNADFTAVGYFGLVGATVSGVYFAGELLIPGGWESLPQDSSYDMGIINNTSSDGVWMAPYLFGK